MEFVFHHGVVVFSVGIPGQPVASVVRGECGVIVERDGDDALCPVDQQARVEPFFHVACHVVHAGLVAFFEPLPEGVAVEAVDGCGGGHAACRKAETQGLGLYLPCVYCS